MGKITAENRTSSITRLGLPENATDDQIEAECRKRLRHFATTLLDLPEEAADSQIATRFKITNRKFTASQLGLPEDATDSQITAAWAKRKR